MEVEQEAIALGWTPKESFKGDPERWIDAAEFVERGHHIMPILKKNNEKLLGQVEQLSAQVGTLQASVAAFDESSKELKKFHEESTKAQVEKARRDVLAELKTAREAEDIDGELAATAKLSQFDAAQAAVAANPRPTGTPAEAKPAPVAPEVQAWMKEHSWYGVDQIRTGLAIGVANQFRANGDTRVGAAFLDAVAEVVAEKLGDGNSKAPPGKVEGARGGGGGRSGGTDYASLPADAREVCDKQAAKFVGANKVFKTAKEWNSHYAAEYFKGN